MALLQGQRVGLGLRLLHSRVAGSLCDRINSGVVVAALMYVSRIYCPQPLYKMVERVLLCITGRNSWF
jgi:hypothetical protein